MHLVLLVKYYLQIVIELLFTLLL